MRLPIIICNRGRKGESKIGTAVSTTGYTAIVRFLEDVTTLVKCGFVHTILARLDNNSLHSKDVITYRINCPKIGEKENKNGYIVKIMIKS